MVIFCVHTVTYVHNTIALLSINKIRLMTFHISCEAIDVQYMAVYNIVFIICCCVFVLPLMLCHSLTLYNKCRQICQVCQICQKISLLKIFHYKVVADNMYNTIWNEI